MVVAFIYIVFLAASVSSIHLRQLQSLRTHAHRDTQLHPNSNDDPGLTARDTPIPIMRERRVSSIITSLSTTSDDITTWLSSLDSNGKWPDVNYATGCAAQRANWPAQDHWYRLKLMAGAYHGGVTNVTGYEGDTRLLTAVISGMNWWFARDFTNIKCLDHGGTNSCPCNSDDITLWNTNWYSNVIGTPSLVIQTCLIMDASLPAPARDHCVGFSSRSYGTFEEQPRPGYLSGANILDICRISIDQGLLTANNNVLTSAYKRTHDEITIKTAVKADGIRPDGSFGQHGGLLYNGNYGEDYANDVLDLELVAAGTEFSAESFVRTVFDTLFDADRWMVFYNTLSGKVFWDFSVLPRFISFPVADLQATSGLLVNFDNINTLGSSWNATTLKTFAALKDKNNMDRANAGKLYGNRMFYANDYMVHRGKGYVSTLKMYSSRTKNTECTNSQNPFGFHLSDGVLYTYQHGNEYEDIAAAWDWDMVPGSTVDYNATRLSCDKASFTGIVPFVGGVSTGSIGVSAMRYINPYTKTLQWQKTWFFLVEDVQYVMVSNLSSTTSAPVKTVLDQKRQSGKIAIDSQPSVSFAAANKTVTRSGASSLWHDSVGYVFNSTQPTTLNVQSARKTGDWSAVGISKQPPAEVQLFTAWLEHDPKTLGSPIAYAVFPGVDRSTFLSKSRAFSLQSTVNDAHASAIYDQTRDTVMAVFWDADGGLVTLNITTPENADAALTIQVSGNSALIYDRAAGHLYVSDPSQMRKSVYVKLAETKASKQVSRKSATVTLPQDGTAGSTQIVNV